MSTSVRAQLDPFTAQAENKDLTLQEKIRDLHTVINAAKTGMLVTRNADGSLHSRAMNPAAMKDQQLDLIFLANNVSGKFEEIEHDSHVNVSFYDATTTSWVSHAGVARILQDKELIHKYWSTLVTGYIGDLQDGVHHGDVDDPRVSVIQVIPDEIHYWFTNQGAVSRTVQVAAASALGKATSPGEMRTITNEEVHCMLGVSTR